MVPDFYVFDTNQACNLIINIEYLGFNVYVCEKGLSSLTERLTNENRFRVFCSEDLVPTFCIVVDEDILEESWVKTVLINGGSSTTKPEDFNFQRPFTLKREYKPPGEEVIIDGIKSHLLSTPPADIDFKGGYNYHSFYDETLDIKYYEIKSPSSETPFTVVVNNFKLKDDSWLFSDIYASSAWASNNMECRYDFHFLTVLWKQLKLPGEFTMDVVKRRVDACYPDRVKTVNDLESEPSVYRRSMLEVIGMKRKRLGIDFIETKDPRLE